LIGKLAGRLLVLLPGVPSELRGLLPAVLSWLTAGGHLPSACPTLLYRTAQLAETTLVRRCETLHAAHADLHWSWWLVRYGVDVQITFTSSTVPPAEVSHLDRECRSRLEPWVYATRAQGLNEVVQEQMISRGRTLSVAESCTAGLLGARLTELAGSSAFFRGGVMVYADEVKRDMLGVADSVLSVAGAVSCETAVAMAEGCRQRFGTDYAVAITGIAGPEGGSAEKPVGTTWLAVACRKVTWARRYHFPGSRRRNRQLAVAAALDSLRRLLDSGDANSPWRAEDSWGRSP
jgi:nicotinamide-nucleotide amidase